MVSKISNVNIGNSGEYYVAAELERRGFIVAVPMSNVDNFDVLAINKNAPYNQYAIQVKTTTKKNWLLSKKNENIVGDNIYYVFVKLVGDEQPKYYIYPSSFVAEKIRKSHHEWLAKPGKNGKPHNDNNLREFESDEEHLNLWEFFK